VSGAVIAVIGFGILATFGRGNQAWGYALVMGFTLGMIIGMLVSSWRAMKFSISESTDEPAEKGWAKKYEERTKKVTEI